MLPVSQVRVNGRAASYTQGEHELVVTPRTALRDGQHLNIDVTYAGVPSTITSDGIKPWIRTDDGVAAVGEPEIAAWWYPSNDHPRDKATFDVSVTVARDLEVLGNGVLVSDDVNRGERTWHWRERKPMATYLAFFVVGQFDITSSRADGLPVVTAVASDGGSEGEYAAADLARTPEVIRFESRQFGPYPFDAMGGVAPAADVGFALENQTRPVYTRGFWRNGPNIYVVVHELAHQWYGDSVSVQNWRDIWLNEGFASFAEWLWSEKHGEGTGAAAVPDYWDYYAGSDRLLERASSATPAPSNEFNGAVYDRGAMTLQALRTRIGDDAFFTTMRKWAAERRYGNGAIRGVHRARRAGLGRGPRRRSSTRGSTPARAPSRPPRTGSRPTSRPAPATLARRTVPVVVGPDPADPPAAGLARAEVIALAAGGWIRSNPRCATRAGPITATGRQASREEDPPPRPGRRRRGVREAEADEGKHEQALWAAAIVRPPFPGICRSKATARGTPREAVPACRPVP